MTEKEKMLAGQLYDATDPELVNDRTRARSLLHKINNELSEEEKDLRMQLIHELLGESGDGLWIEPPFFCDYGYNIKAGKNVYMNFNCCILDVMEVTIGDNVLLGTSVQIYTATHPMDARTRSAGLEFARPVSIGNDVWIGGGAIICPGVTIGNRTVVGAGAVVTKDVPDDVFAGGNPAKPIRGIEEN